MRYLQLTSSFGGHALNSPLPIAPTSNQQCSNVQKTSTFPFLSKMGILNFFQEILIAPYCFIVILANTWEQGQQHLQHQQLLIGHHCYQVPAMMLSNLVLSLNVATMFCAISPQLGLGLANFCAIPGWLNPQNKHNWSMCNLYDQGQFLESLSNAVFVSVLECITLILNWVYSMNIFQMKKLYNIWLHLEAISWYSNEWYYARNDCLKNKNATTTTTILIGNFGQHSRAGSGFKLCFQLPIF